MYVDRDVDDCVWWKSLHEVVWLARVHKEGIRDMVASVSNGHEAAKARRALFSGLLGTTLEWYEFFCFGIASALVFGRLFFPSEDPLVGTMLALSTFSVAFIVRPIGAVVCGYLGDKFGRKNILVITLITMGVATFGIGILPTYQQVGILAPVLLIVLRVFQGLSLGGEFSGTVLMSVEHAKPERKGFFGALMNVGIPVGLFLANGIFFLVSLADDGFLMTWGWRIPFLVSVILVGVGFYIRMGVTESPEFSELKESAEVVENPSKEAFRFHWKRILLVAFTYFGCGVAFYASNTFVITYLEAFVGVNESLILSTMMIGFAFLAVSIVFFGWLSDKINRRLLLASSFALFIPASFLFFHLIEYGTPGNDAAWFRGVLHSAGREPRPDSNRLLRDLPWQRALHRDGIGLHVGHDSRLCSDTRAADHAGDQHLGFMGHRGLHRGRLPPVDAHGPHPASGVGDSGPKCRTTHLGVSGGWTARAWCCSPSRSSWGRPRIG